MKLPIKIIFCPFWPALVCFANVGNPFPLLTFWLGLSMGITVAIWVIEEIR